MSTYPCCAAGPCAWHQVYPTKGHPLDPATAVPASPLTDPADGGRSESAPELASGVPHASPLGGGAGSDAAGLGVTSAGGACEATTTG